MVLHECHVACMAMEVEEQIRHMRTYICTVYNTYINILYNYIYIVHVQNLPMPLNRHTRAQCTHSYMYVACGYTEPSTKSQEWAVFK